MTNRTWAHSALATALATAAVSATMAAPITYTGSQGSLAASAEFTTSGNDLVVTLSNTTNADVLVPADLLTAVFFNVAGSPALGSGSAVLGPTSTVLFGGSDPGGVVGGEWALATNLNGAPLNSKYGIGSAGFGLFGGATFPGSDLDGPAAVNGMNYGIASFGDNPATGNAPVTGANPLIKYQVVFTLSGLPAGFDPSTAISNVWFQYGTDLAEPGFQGVPEPHVGALCLAGLLVIGRRR